MSITLELEAAFDRARSGEIADARRRIDTIRPDAAESRRDRLLALLAIHDLWLAPLPRIGEAAHLQLDGSLSQLKASLEREVIAEMDEAARSRPVDRHLPPAEAMRRLAAVDLVPPLYRWLAAEATRDEIDRYLAIEGGPDGGFDDLVAICQVGITGRPKVELGRNYWDEMGQGELADVHTNLHDDMVAALGLEVPGRGDVPDEALARSVLGSLLATNRVLQPEMVGALGFIELQAGPRSREVARGLRRVGAPAAALPFYDEHATADPRHGKAWLDEVVRPLGRQEPLWGPRMVRGAQWRAAVNDRFFRWAEARFGAVESASARAELVGADR